MTPHLPPAAPGLPPQVPRLPGQLAARALLERCPELACHLSLDDIACLSRVSPGLHERIVTGPVREKAFCLRFPGTVPVEALRREHYDSHLRRWLEGFAVNRRDRQQVGADFSSDALFFSLARTLRQTPALTLVRRDVLDFSGSRVKNLSFSPDSTELLVETAVSLCRGPAVTHLLSLDCSGGWHHAEPLPPESRGADCVSYSARNRRVAVVQQGALVTVMDKLDTGQWKQSLQVLHDGLPPYPDYLADACHEERYHQLDSRYLPFLRAPESPARIRRVWFSGDGNSLVITDTACDLQVWSWNKETRQWQQGLGVPGGPHDKKIQFSVDGRWLAVHSGARVVRLYMQYLSGFWTEHTRIEYERFVFQVQFSPDTRHLFLALSDGSAALWKLDGNGCVESARLHHDRGLIDARFSPDARSLVARCLGRQLALWTRSVSGDWRGPVPLGGGMADTFCFSPDSRHLFTADCTPGAPGGLTSWIQTSQNRWDRECSLTFEHPTGIKALQPSPDGSHLWVVHTTVQGDRELVMWSQEGDGPRWHIKAGLRFPAAHGPGALAVSPDCSHLALDMGDRVCLYQLREDRGSAA